MEDSTLLAYIVGFQNLVSLHCCFFLSSHLYIDLTYPPEYSSLAPHMFPGYLIQDFGY